MPESKPVTWLLAPNYLVAGRVSLLVGEEGIGKSMWTMRALAAVSTGEKWGPFTIGGEPRDAIIIATEDDCDHAVLPRLELAGANPKHIIIGDESLIVPNDMDSLRALSVGENATFKPALVVVDSWVDTVPSGLSLKDTQRCREALRPWKEYAADTGAAVLLVTHVNRIASSNARDTYGLSVGLRQAARSAIYVLRDGDELIVGPEKSNVGRTDVPAERFRISPVNKFEPTEANPDGTVGRLDYVGSSECTVGQHLAAKQDGQLAVKPDAVKPGKVSRTADIDEWIAGYFDALPLVKTADLDAAAEARGFGSGQLRGAKQRAGLVPKKVRNEWFTYRDDKLTNRQVDETPDKTTQQQDDKLTKRQDDEVTDISHLVNSSSCQFVTETDEPDNWQDDLQDELGRAS